MSGRWNRAARSRRRRRIACTTGPRVRASAWARPRASGSPESASGRPAFIAVMASVSDQVTGCGMIAADLPTLRRLAEADLGRVGATSVEAAAGGRIDRRGQVPGQADALRAADGMLDTRHRRQQGLGIGMAR